MLSGRSRPVGWTQTSITRLDNRFCLSVSSSGRPAMMEWCHRLILMLVDWVLVRAAACRLCSTSQETFRAERWIESATSFLPRIALLLFIRMWYHDDIWFSSSSLLHAEAFTLTPELLSLFFKLIPNRKCFPCRAGASNQIREDGGNDEQDQPCSRGSRGRRKNKAW